MVAMPPPHEQEHPEGHWELLSSASTARVQHDPALQERGAGPEGPSWAPFSLAGPLLMLEN